MDRRSITFRQAEGLEPLPSPLALGEISPEFRSLAWFAAHESMSLKQGESTGWKSWIDDQWHQIMRDWHVKVEFNPVDEFYPNYNAVMESVKIKFFHWPLPTLFDFITFILRHPRCSRKFEFFIGDAFRDARLAYRIIDKTIFPSASEQEGITLSQAYADLAGAEFNGAKAHLRMAADLLSQGDNAGCVRESIHSVEATARLISPGSNTLDPALKALAASGHVHPALQAGFSKLYGYVNDEKGIRHPLLEGGTADVDRTDAVYMIGACAAFVSYLLNRREPSLPPIGDIKTL